MTDSAGAAFGDVTTDAISSTDAVVRSATLAIWTSRPLGSIAVVGVLGADGSSTPCALTSRVVEDKAAGTSVVDVYQQQRALKNGVAAVLS